MFVDSPTKRTPVTANLRNEIIALRSRRGYTTNYFATNILGKPQSWLAQIEGGKTKTIKNSDLIYLFSKLLDLDKDETDVYLKDHYEKLFVEDLPDADITEFDNAEKKNKISFFKAKTVRSEDELRKIYKKYINNLDEGLMIFFAHVDDKNDALNILKDIVQNLHQDMGFTLSVAALPLGRMREIDDEEKKAAFFEIVKVLKEYGKLQFDEEKTD